LTASRPTAYTGSMCGRFTQKYRSFTGCTWLTQPVRNIRPQYNICPTDLIDVIHSERWRLLATCTMT